MPVAGPLQAARALLPWWVLWGGVLFVPLAFVASAILTALTARGALRPAKDGHWTERARRAFVARRTTSFATAMKPVEVQTYARALERIYEVNLTPAVLGGRPMHPHLYDRLLAAGVQPSYPRPAPPRRDAYAAVVVAPLGVFGLAMAVVAATPEGRKLDEPALLRKMALTGGDATQVGDLALLRWKAGDAAAAATLYRAELALGDDGVYPRSDLAIVLAGEGLCDEARNAVAPLDGGQLRGKASKRHVDAGGAVAQCYVRRAFRPRDDASGMEWSSGCGTS